MGLCLLPGKDKCGQPCKRLSTWFTCPRDSIAVCYMELTAGLVLSWTTRDAQDENQIDVSDN